MRCIAAIPARYQASRFPGKLMERLGEKTVIRTTYERVSAMELFDEIMVITDSEAIFHEMNSHGARVLISQKQHHTGTDRISEIAEDLEADIIVNVQGDEPFIERRALEKLLKVFKKDIKGDIQLSTLAHPLKDPFDIQNPHRVKVVTDKNDFALYFSRSSIPYYREGEERADYLGHIGVYAFRKQALIDFTSLPILANERAERLECLRFLEHGRKVKIVRTTYKVIGIDTLEDLQRARKKLLFYK
ncbi:3-deoxy-manno-octulosonate cytidylyltransferase [Bacteroidetes bacterium endosymbiont of Geopemphigus sp.]|uniref:3-deoxy-manno-octulosonate cytidylyltransferase n=1 Tax=Bacteroidetes bacterium endosymbiont of Geopemphigus sp. TaxID=2047937 RepID=UPI000CD224E0|nr:3-deoxy-manno-octulosonate cytidylyltransferase [Bacteroidetes bacterium endosymbiont of Geopemphigus sp.]